jgi:threonyl-tRNA synthetase
VRGFTQDDAHIFCLPEQLRAEIEGIIDFVFDTMKVFGFDQVGIELSTRPEKFIGTREDWENATMALEEALKDKGLEYEVNEAEGAFYGPKIDIKLKDALRRKWQCATIQCDFALPKRFDLSYIDAQGSKQQPIMLHRVLLGSIERFIGALIEHYNAELPLWLAAEQVRLIPIKDSLLDYAMGIKSRLDTEGIRSDIDSRTETLDKRIRQAEMDKVPYCLVIGEREAKNNEVALRKRGQGNLGSRSFEEFLAAIKEEIASKKTQQGGGP